MRTFRTLAALATAAACLLPATQGNAAELLPTDWAMDITLQDGASTPTYTTPRSDLPVTARRWDCSSTLETNAAAETRTFTATCVPQLPNLTVEAGLPDVCQPGVRAAIISLVPGNYVSGAARCGTSGASCTAYATQPSPNFHGDCHLDAPAPVPGRYVSCSATWTVVTSNTSWSVSCHDHA